LISTSRVLDIHVRLSHSRNLSLLPAHEFIREPTTGNDEDTEATAWIFPTLMVKERRE
jgi:hypothetical protein